MEQVPVGVLRVAACVLLTAALSAEALRPGGRHSINNKLCTGVSFVIGDKQIRTYDELSKFFSYYTLIPRIDSREMVAVSIEVHKPCGVFSKNLTLYLRASTKDLRLLKDAFQQAALQSVLNSVFNKTAPEHILVLGAHTGMQPLYLSLRYPKSKIAAVEPDLSDFALLRLNTAQRPQVQHLEYGAAWDRAATVKFGRDMHGRSLWQRFVVDVMDMTTGRIGELVPALHVDDLLTKYGWPGVDLVVSDLEGAEHVVLADANAKGWLARTKCLAVRPLEHPPSTTLYKTFSGLKFTKRSSRGGYVMWCRSDVGDL